MREQERAMGKKNLLIPSPCGLHSGDLVVFRLLIRYFSALKEGLQSRRPNIHHFLCPKCGSHFLCPQSYCCTKNISYWCLYHAVLFQVIIRLDSKWKTLILTVDAKTVNEFRSMFYILLSCPSTKSELLSIYSFTK